MFLFILFDLFHFTVAAFWFERLSLLQLFPSSPLLLFSVCSSSAAPLLFHMFYSLFSCWSVLLHFKFNVIRVLHSWSTVWKLRVTSTFQMNIFYQKRGNKTKKSSIAVFISMTFSSFSYWVLTLPNTFSSVWSCYKTPFFITYKFHSERITLFTHSRPF